MKYQSALYVLREGRFVKLPPKKIKYRRRDWRGLVFVSMLIGGMLFGYLVHSL